MKFSRYCKIYKSDVDPDTVVLFSTKKASKIVIPESMVKDIEGGRITEEEKETLTDLGFLVMSAEDEKAEMGQFIDDLNAIDTIFAAKVVMNLDCNFACKYCFEGQRKGKFFMTPEIADCFIEFVKAKATSEARIFEEIRLTFYGGEPLLSVDLILYISERIKALAENNGITYTAYIITNGSLLTLRNVERLRALELKEASVTIDGPKEIHDQFRPFRTGKGSFDLIIRNLKEACELIDIEVGGNFTRDNYREFPRLLDYMMKEGLTPDKLSGVRFDPVTQESEGIALTDFRDGCASFNEPWVLEAVIYLREEILRRGYRTGKITPMPCLLDIKDRIVVNYDGSIYKCPGLIGREEYKIGDIKTGIKDYSTSHNLDNWKNQKCLDCEYLPLCFGGCRYMKLVRDGNMDGVDCRKPYLDATLETLVKQDIKYGLTGN
jgi:uncharacterized protein